MSQAIPSVGVLLNRESETPGTFEAVPEVKSITGPTGETEQIDVTTLGSTGGRREFMAGFRDEGEVTAEINFVPTDEVHQAMRAQWAAGTVHKYQIEFPTSPNHRLFTFDALVRTFPVAADPASAVTGTITLKITGAIVESDAT